MVASIENVRRSGRFEEYLRGVPTVHHAELFHSTAGLWISIDAALAHYMGVDRLDILPDEHIAMGRRSAERVGATFLGRAIRLSTEAGLTPWSFLPHLNRFWRRGYDGGGIAIAKLGPKEALIDLVGMVLCQSTFFRGVLLGYVATFTEVFCKKAYAQDSGSPHGSGSMRVRVQWA